MKNAISLSILQKAPRYFLEPLFLLLVLSIIFFMNIYDDLLNFLPILGVFIYSTLRSYLQLMQLLPLLILLTRIDFL